MLSAMRSVRDQAIRARTGCGPPVLPRARGCNFAGSLVSPAFLLAGGGRTRLLGWRSLRTDPLRRRGHLGRGDLHAARWIGKHPPDHRGAHVGEKLVEQLGGLAL